MARELTVYQITEAVPYDEALAFQRRVVDTFSKNPRDTGALILLEHPPVITIGRSGSNANVLASEKTLAAAGVTVRETNRGGDVTYHGPGQIVGYPILPLQFHGKDVHAYLRRLEALLIATLDDYGIKAGRCAGYTGVWVEDAKVASIGVAISHWITYHGFALNLAPNLDHFKLIHPCGIAGVEITSITELLERTPDRAEVEERLIKHFCAEFGFTNAPVVNQLCGSDQEL